MRGRFITVEGIEGTGKSTNIEFLTSRIAARGRSVVTSREPGGTPMAEKIRELLLDHGQEPMPPIAELLLFFAARSLHLQNMILPALEDGLWVVCDRFTDASRAYQGAGRGLPPDSVETLAGWVLDGLEPDLTFLLDAPAATGLARAAARAKRDRMDDETVEFYERVRAAYLALAAREPARFVVIDAGQALADVQRDIEQGLSRLFTDDSH